MTRIVFDPGLSPSDYVSAVRSIKAVSAVMGQPVDSDGLKSLSVSQYRARMALYFDTFGSIVDLWEVGNEINGEWTGNVDEVAAKVQAGFDEAKSRRLNTAMTLYFNSTCSPDPSHEMISWANSHVSDSVKRGVDYVLVSYYPDDCAGSPDWKTIFKELTTMFPNAKVGFGEIGTKDPNKKEAMIRQFYSMADPSPNFVGGYFWWYFSEDAVPSSQALWRVFNDVIK